LTVQALSEHGARAELRHEADRRGILLTDEVMEYLLTRFARDLKSLFDLLDRLDDFSMAQQRSVTVPLLKQMLAQGHMA
jgi:DnaA-homolog protein